MGQCRFNGETEGGDSVLRFNSFQVQEGDGRWRTVWQRQPDGWRRLGQEVEDCRAHLSVRGRRRADWAGKGGRRWAAAGLEKEGGGGLRLGWKRREEAGLKLLLGLKSKRVKRKSILIDFWIKIGLEIE
jgi:hypothetical protein